MEFGDRLKNIRESFNLTQDKLASILHVSRQAITKWENNEGMPEISNLNMISKTFNISIDALLNMDNLPIIGMSINLDKSKYKNKLSLYKEVLNDYFDDCLIYILSYTNKLGKLEGILDLFSLGSYALIKDASDLSPYYLVINNGVNMLVNIKDYVLSVVILSDDINIKKFRYKDKKFINCGLMK